MLLFELFDDDSDSGSMIDDLRQQVMDYLTPLAAKKVPYIPISSIQDVLQNARTGLIIDRGLIMNIIEPNVCKLVSKIEGDKVYLSLPVDDISAHTEEDEERAKQRIEKKASDTAKKSLK